MSMLVNQKDVCRPALRLTGWDVWILALAVVCSLFLLFSPAGEAGQVCIITWEGGEMVLPLQEPETMVLESGGITLVVAVSDGEVRITESGCPDGVCVRTGAIRKGGEIIVCVPAGVVIRIPGEAKEDFIVG